MLSNHQRNHPLHQSVHSKPINRSLRSRLRWKQPKRAAVMLALSFLGMGGVSVVVGYDDPPPNAPTTSGSTGSKGGGSTDLKSSDSKSKVQIRFAPAPGAGSQTVTAPQSGTGSQPAPGVTTVSSQDSPKKAPPNTVNQPNAIKQPPTKDVPVDGKLTADVERSSISPAPPKSTSTPPITVATAEERNQKIAPDWKDPWAVFYVTGKQYGYMEPCGCTGLENQKGGLSRRDSLLTSLRDRGWPMVPVDAGDQVRRLGRQSEIKYEWTIKALREMGYVASTYGEDDLQINTDSILISMLDSTGNNDLLVSANVNVFDGYDMPFKVTEVGGRKIGITAVLGDENARKVLSSNVKIENAIASLKKVLPKLREKKCDYLVLITHASLEESRKIAQAYPDFNLVITSGGYGEPTFRPEQIAGTKAQMIQVGTKGMYVGLFGLFDDPKQPFRYQRIALSSQFEDSNRMAELFGKYQDELKITGFEGLGLRPMSHPSTRDFVGSQTCADCHSTAFKIWEETPHAHATESVIEPPQRSLARNFDPECLSCHVTGWNPQGFFPYRTGFDSMETTPHMAASGCENCHGPGAKHVEAENGDDKELMKKLREEMRLPLDRAETKCLECHDIDNSPDFHKEGAFQAYWERIKHYGKD